MASSLFAVYNKNCGHILQIANDRRMAEDWISRLTVAGKWGWRIRADPSDFDLIALVAGERCDVCTLDGITTTGATA